MAQKKVKEIYNDFLEDFFELLTPEEENTSLSILFDKLPVCFWMHDEDYSIIYANRAVEEMFGPCYGRKYYEYFMKEYSICNCCLSKSILSGQHDERCSHCRRSNKAFDIDIFHIPFVSKDGKKFIVKSNMHIHDMNFLNNK